LDQQGAGGGPEEGANHGEGRPARIDRALAGEVGSGGEAAEDGLGLVGGQGGDGGKPDPEQGGQRDQPAATGDGVH